MQSFIFDPSKGETPGSLARKRKIAEALAGNVGAPKNVGEGLTAVGNALAYRMMMAKADKAEASGRDSARGPMAAIAAALAGPGAFPAAPSSAPGMDLAAAPKPADPNVGSTIDFANAKPGGNPAYRDAIASIESAGSGDYAAVGPTHPKLGRALGRYQVMEANIGPWSKKHLGREISADEFMANPQLQDAIFDAEFGSYVQKFGPEGAAQAWFGGPGGVGKTGRTDVLGTSVGQYGDKFAKALGSGTQVASLDPSIGIPPDAMTQTPVPRAPEQQAGLLLGRPTASISPQPISGGVPLPIQQGQPNAQIAQALTAMPEMAGNTRPIPKDGPDMQMLMEALSNPWLPEGQQGVVEALIGQQLQERDPATAMQRRKMELELQALENPQGDPFTLSPGEVRFGPDGKQIAAGGEKQRDLPSAVQEYEYAKGQGFPGTFQDWEASKKGGMSLQVDPATGAVTFQQGNMKPLTEGQSKDTVFSTRAQGALPLIDKFGDALTSLPESMAGQVPIAGNYMKSPEFQQAEQAGKEFLQAILRKDTGAAITAEETAEYGSVYLPRPGDSPELLAQKRASRQRAVAAIEAGMPAQAILAKERALANTGQPEAPAVVIDGYTIEQVD